MTSIGELLKGSGFKFNKRYGQNFITDSNLLNAIVKDAGIANGDCVLEIGAGAGTLTLAAAKVAGKVVSYEIDPNLKPILDSTLAQVRDKTEIVFKDFLKEDYNTLLEKTGVDYKVVANLPYYVTTPCIMRLLECAVPPKSITVMVQKEVAERLAADAGNSNYGAISVAVRLAGDAKITRIVSRKMFYPVPNVDSAIVRIDLKSIREDRECVRKLVRGAFSMRRKTLLNNLTAMGYQRETAENALCAIGLDIRVRGEELSAEQFIALTDALTNIK